MARVGESAWDKDHCAEIIVDYEESDGTTVDITCSVDGMDVTVSLDARGTRQLRLILQRAERGVS